jgi:methylmalonyl-CoA mutase
MTVGGGQPVGDDWMALVERTLRGRGLDELLSSTRDGIEIRPLYSDGPPTPAAVRVTNPSRAERGWDVRSGYRVAAGAGADEAHVLRQQIADDLSGGATSIELELVDGGSDDRLETVLASVDLGGTPTALAPHAELDVAAALLSLAARRGETLAPRSTLGVDPLGEWARRGRSADCASAAGWTARAATSGSLRGGVMAFCVDAVRYADAGATEAQALGWATATGVAYLRALVESGVSVDAAAGLIGFRLSATADQFVTIAALRAARVMWARVVTASGGSAQAARQYQHAVTATHMYSRRDPWVNLLRAATASLAAGVAGADAVTVLPFDHASGTVDAGGGLGRRLARNTQLLLLEESHLARAADPAGGSFYVESLTEELASEGWRVLQDVEASGGIESAIGSGALAAAIDESWQSRTGALRTRSEPLTGVSEFPLLNEPAPQSADVSDASATTGGLPIRRLAEPFESLRDDADRHQATTGNRPAAWVAALGSASSHSARTAWAQNLLAAGGIESRGEAGVDSPVAAAADFAASGLTAVVITGSDEMYRLRGPATAAALKDAGAGFVAVVGDSSTAAERLEALASAGVGEVWHDGIDAAAALERLHHTLGIA